MPPGFFSYCIISFSAVFEPLSTPGCVHRQPDQYCEREIRHLALAKINSHACLYLFIMHLLSLVCSLLRKFFLAFSSLLSPLSFLLFSWWLRNIINRFCVVFFVKSLLEDPLILSSRLITFLPSVGWGGLGELLCFLCNVCWAPQKGNWYLPLPILTCQGK